MFGTLSKQEYLANKRPVINKRRSLTAQERADVSSLMVPGLGLLPHEQRFVRRLALYERITTKQAGYLLRLANRIMRRNGLNRVDPIGSE